MSAQLKLPAIPKLPLIPGFIIHKQKENNRLPHCFVRIEGTDWCVEKHTDDKDWILNSKRILCFKANCCGNSDKSQIDKNWPIKILYFTEDGTIQVIEQRRDHSGNPVNACIVKRQHIPRDSIDHDDYLTIGDLNVQEQVTIFGKTYTIIDCDNYTRLYLNKSGIVVPKSIEAPTETNWTNGNRLKKQSIQEKLRRQQKDDTKHQRFLKYDLLRLYFEAYWDDRDSPFGEIHNLGVYYYLSDHTFQINEFPINSKPVTFYKRLRLPKKTEDVFSIYEKPNPLVLGARPLEKCVQDKSDHSKICDVDYYSDIDLKIGQTINVFGREVMLTDCDEFTKDYYRSAYGLEEFIPIKKPVDPRWSPVEVEKSLPPYNGWGSIEDSESSCRLISQLKPGKRTTKTILQQNNIKLRFKAQLLDKTDEDSRREFILTYHLDDDTISVFEKRKLGSAFSGEFIKRTKFYLPHQCLFTNHRPDAYTPQMMYIGATIGLNRYIFHLIDADEFTLNFMESHATEYPMSNINTILDKIRGAFESSMDYRNFLCKYVGEVPVLGEITKSKSMKLCYYTTSTALKELLGKDISEHEIVTFLRYFDVDKSTNKTQTFNRSTIQALVQKALANRLWEDIETLKQHIHAADPLKQRLFMPKEKLCSIIKGCRFPINGILLNHMFFVLKKDKNGCIDIDDLLKFIDTNKYKAPPIEPIPIYDENNKKSFESSDRPKLVDWGAFISKLGIDPNIEVKSYAD